MGSMHKSGADAAQHLMELREAIDNVQPLADYRGNFAALHAAITMLRALQKVAGDFAWLRAGEREMP